MQIGLVIAGLIVGVLVAGGGHYFVGAVGGAFLAIGLARITKLQTRVRDLEEALHQLKSEPRDPLQTTRVEPATPPTLIPGAAPEDIPAQSSQPAANAAFETPPAAATVHSFADEEPASSSSGDAWQVPKKVPKGWLSKASGSAGPDIVQKLIKQAMGWISSGNVPVKIGVIISFFGVSFLLKYAIDRELVVLPLEFRLLAVAAAGLAMVVVGWRLRERLRVYGLSLQGGGIGILFLTIFAALRLWDLLPATLSFFLLVGLTLFTGVLAVVQNSRSLAILGITGGFLAPVLTSTGQGSHVALFSYYLVLNLAILGISWFRAWRGLNLVGFFFTFVIASMWGYRYYRPAYFSTTEPFLIAHFLLYHAIAILYALRQPPSRLGMVDGSLVFGMPIIAFALQASLLRYSEYGLAISAASAALIYIGTASWLFRKKDDDLRLLTESYLALAVGFATITIPLALDARWTSAAWAVEGAALVWLGTRQHRLLAKGVGVALILFSGLSFTVFGWRNGVGWPVLNGNVLGGVLISLSAFFASRKLITADLSRFWMAHRLSAYLLFVWAVLWWLGTGWEEIEDRVIRPDHAPVFLLFGSLSMGMAAWLGRRMSWNLLRWASMMLLPLLIWMGIEYLDQQHHFLGGLGWLAWPVAWLAQVYVLRLLDKSQEPLANEWHFVSLLSLALFLSWDAGWWTEQFLSAGWAVAVASLVPGIMALLIWRFRETPPWPAPVHPASYFSASILLVAGQAFFLAWCSLIQPGTPDPWPYIPVLNPFDLAMLFAMLTAWLSWKTLQRDCQRDEFKAWLPALPVYKALLAVLFFIMTTFALVRGVHHYTSVPWGMEQLFRSDIVQTALSIYWGLLGFGGMILGARKVSRPIWLVGVAFMALVVIKLFLVDLGNSGTIERIISFIGIGVLLLVVGYFAPAPPRRAAQASADEVLTEERGE